MQLSDKSSTIQLLKANKLYAQKSLGQNFLINDHSLEAIVKAAKISPEDTIIEVGPGLGVLTQELCKAAKKVISIELDSKLAELLKTRLAGFKNLQIVKMDALQYQVKEKNYKVVANIPYYITSPLINHFVRNENPPQSLTMLVQKEVAEKICSNSEKERGILWLQVALFGEAKMCKIVPAGHFHPVPKVDSAIIHIELYSKKSPNFVPSAEAEKVLKMAKIAFSGRRKKLRNTLGHLLTTPSIDLNRRPQTLSVGDWRELCEIQG